VVVSDQLDVSDTVVALVELDGLKVEEAVVDVDEVRLGVVAVIDDVLLPVAVVAVVESVDVEVVSVPLKVDVVVGVCVETVELAVSVVLVAVLPVPPLHVQQTSWAVYP